MSNRYQEQAYRAAPGWLVIGIGNGARTSFQAINLRTDEKQPIQQSYDEAEATIPKAS